MTWLRICNIALLGTLISAAVHADLVPPNGGVRQPHYSPLYLTVGGVPKGMVLLFLDGDGKLLAKAHGDETLVVDEAGKVYAARERQLSKPFSFKTDRAKLFPLKSYVLGDLPQSYGRPRDPEAVSCKMQRSKSGDYSMTCGEQRRVSPGTLR